jgi:hypothetical protein
MKNKGQAELFFGMMFFFLIMLLVYLAFSRANPYNSYKSDCEKIYSRDFVYNSTCNDANLSRILNGQEDTTHECVKVNYDDLSEFCLNKYTGDLKK